MKKSNYITKYDYINYYTKQPAMWFFKNEEIQANYNLQLKKIQETVSYIDIYDLIEDEDEIEEFDSYNAYRELLENGENIDEENALLISGRIIDEKSKEHIAKFYENKYNEKFKVVDFDLEKCSLETNNKKTLKLIEENDFLILFQPVFIDIENGLLTKCDGFIKYFNEIYLIETKATSTAKFVHFLDLFFQKKIIEKTLSTTKYDLNYQLCLIKYEYLCKHEISFILSSTINFKKTVATSGKIMDDENKQWCKIGADHTYFTKRKNVQKEQKGLMINSVLDLNYGEIKEYFEKKEVLFDFITNVVNSFYRVIEELWEFKKNLEIKCKIGEDSKEVSFLSEFLPHRNDKSQFKNTDMWIELKYLYLKKGMIFFKYSGNVLDQSANNLEKITDFYLKGLEPSLDEFIRGSETEVKKNLFFKPGNEFIINKKEYWNIMQHLKNKHVYFDFETINPAIRVVSKSLPFSQVVTQCSILKKHENGFEDNCINLMEDPLKLDISFFKEVVDKLYEGNDYSYVVYNKTFEKKRLEEFIDYIQDEEYTQKINCIINNLFDLADFFKVTNLKQVIFIKELGGFYSIKKVLPLVDKYAKNIFEETKCLDYHDLEIGNGLVCQTKSLQRFYKIIDDENKWNQILEDSKKYCENDVRAMVAVLHFIEWLYDNNPMVVYNE